MLYDEFNHLMDDWGKRRKDVLCAKGAEYSTESDKLHNFKRAAALQAKANSPEAAAFNMMIKHIVSIVDMIEKMEDGQRFPIEVWQEKLGDAENYLDLIYAAVTERMK